MPAPPPLLGYFDMNGDVATFSARAAEYLSITPLYNATGTPAMTVRAESHFDKIICVACSVPLQRERLLARGWTPEQISSAWPLQWPVEKKISRADFVAWNDGELCAQVRQLERIFVKL